MTIPARMFALILSNKDMFSPIPQYGRQNISILLCMGSVKSSVDGFLCEKPVDEARDKEFTEP